MKQPTFLEGVVVALAMATAGAALFAALTTLLPGTTVLRLLIAAGGLGYILYLLGRTPERIGRVTVLLAWSLLAGITWFLAPPLLLYLLVHLAAVWLVRSLYHYASVLSALADMALNALALAAAIWAITRTDSVFLAVWSFFLVQALFTGIPRNLHRRSAARGSSAVHDDRFRQAYRMAETAVRRLSSTH